MSLTQVLVALGVAGGGGGNSTEGSSRVVVAAAGGSSSSSSSSSSSRPGLNVWSTSFFPLFYSAKWKRMV